MEDIMNAIGPYDDRFKIIKPKHRKTTKTIQTRFPKLGVVVIFKKKSNSEGNVPITGILNEHEGICLWYLQKENGLQKKAFLVEMKKMFFVIILNVANNKIIDTVPLHHIAEGKETPPARTLVLKIELAKEFGLGYVATDAELRAQSGKVVVYDQSGARNRNPDNRWRRRKQQRRH